MGEFLWRNKVPLITSLGCFGTAVFLYSSLRKYIRQNYSKGPSVRLEDCIRLKDLEALAYSPNIKLKRSAEQVLLDRALREENLKLIVQACYSDDEIQVLKGVVVLSTLVKSVDFKEQLIEFGALEAFGSCLTYSWEFGYTHLKEIGFEDVKLQRTASAALFDLICEEDDNKQRLVDSTPNIIKAVLGLVYEEPSKEVMRWSLFLAHQLAMCDSIRDDMINNRAVSIISQVLVRSQGDIILMRLCLQVLVIFANTSEENEVPILKKIAKYKVIVPTVAALKSEDNELIYWAVALLHEFLMKDLHHAQICSSYNILKSLQNVLTTSEASLQKIVLRVLSFMCYKNKELKGKILHNTQLIARLPICLASGDSDVVYWSVLLTHDLAMQGNNAVKQILSAAGDIVKALVPLSTKQDKMTVRLVAETLGYFCVLDNILNKVVDDGILTAVLLFATSEDTDLKFWASALVLNLCMTSDKVKYELIASGGLRTLIELAISDSDQPQIAAQAAKTLVMLGFLDMPVPVVMKSAGYQAGDFCSIKIRGKEYSQNKPGINLVELDFLTFQVTHSVSFDTGHDVNSTAQLIDHIDQIPNGTLVFIAVRGEANFYITDETKEAFKKIGVYGYDIKTGEGWVLFGQKQPKSRVNVQLKKGFSVVEMNAQIMMDQFVNEQVEMHILSPITDILMSTPAASAISKVAELELLTFLARNDHHKHVMINTEGLVDYLAELVWNMSCKTITQLRANPLVVAHGIGGMKILSALSLDTGCHANLISSGIMSAVISLLYTINGCALNKDVFGYHRSDSDERSVISTGSPTKFTPMGEERPNVSPTKFTFSDSMYGPPTSVTSAPPFSPAPTSCSLSGGTSPEEFEDAFSSLTRLAVSILFNCTKTLLMTDASRNAVLTSGALNVLWCALLTCNETTRNAIGLPVEFVLTFFSHPPALIQERPSDSSNVELNDREKTKALMMSVDCLEILNCNWTFESAHSTVPIGRTMHRTPPYPAGWYYEVTVKSSGIIQVGWRLEDCKYNPEKGLGIGDNHESCGFDGARCKVWNAPPAEQLDNDYGKEWQEGDIVSCLFSWNGEVSFWLNGVNQGVAFKGLNISSSWYPAASLAMDQQCRFNFGTRPFRYTMPEGYISICDVVSEISRRPLRQLSASLAKLSGSFDSIAEEDEEVEHVTVDDEKDKNQIETNDDDLLDDSESREAERGEHKIEHLDLTITDLLPEWDEKPEDAILEGLRTPVRTPRRAVRTPDSLTPITPMPMALSPFGGLPDSPSPVDIPSVPSLYFEADLLVAPGKVRQVGFYDLATKETLFCEISEQGSLILPANVESAPETLGRAPDVIGCGVLWPAATVFFTFDGVGNDKVYRFTNPGLRFQNLLPYVHCTKTAINYGQREFAFITANMREARTAAAQLMYEHGLATESVMTDF